MIRILRNAGDSNEGEQENFPIVNGESVGEVDAMTDRNDANTFPRSKPPLATRSVAPRLLSTCLSTASPLLAWTCRYSGPSQQSSLFSISILHQVRDACTA